MPSSSSHLVLRSSTWHCRIDVPADLRPAFGNRRILSKSLKTGDKLLARELAAAQIGQWKAQFRSIRDSRIRAGDRWRDELYQEATRYQNAMHKLFIETMNGEQDSESQSPELKRSGEQQFQAIIEELKADKRFDLVAEINDLIEEGHTPETAPAWVKRYNAWGQKVVLHRATASDLLNSSQAAEAKSLIAQPSSYKPKSPISTASINHFSDHYAEQNGNARTRSIYLTNLKKLSKWLTTNGKELTFDSVAEFLDSVSKQRQTRMGYLAACRRYHEWACRYDTYYRALFADSKNPFDGHKHAKAGANAGAGWLAYTQEEAERLQAAAMEKGDNDLADLIAFACYTGCRIEEIGRIRLETTVFDTTGTPIAFKVDDSKTSAGIREIPIHSKLLPLYLSRLASTHGEKKFLFAGNDNHKHELRLNALSQRFTKLKRAEEFGDRHVFHSLRKCTATLLLQQGASPVTIPAILGHEYGHITLDIYSAGPSYSQKREAIETLVFNFKKN